MRERIVFMGGVLFAAVAMTAVGADAKMISGNYCSVAQIVDYPAGVYPAWRWNDLTSPAGYGPTGSKADPIYEDGSAAAGTTVLWSTSDGGSQNTNDNVFRPFPPVTLGGDIDDGHDQMMSGYLQASKFSTSEPVITLRVTGLDVAAFGGSYSVILYFDGDDDVASNASRAMFRVWDSQADFIGGGSPLATYYGRDKAGPRVTPGAEYAIDNDGTTPLAVYTLINSTDEFNPTEGNYVRFDNLSGSEFFVRITGVAGQHGVALNGFQIVPEPASVAFLALGSLALLHRRRSAGR